MVTGKTIIKTRLNYEKNLNLKNIKNDLTIMWELANDETNPVTMDEYIELYNAFHEMYVFNFITHDEWGKIFEHDFKLFNGEI